jgi:hypothetical protein
MSVETEVIETEETEVIDELALLKQRADIMGVAYHPNIGIDKLKAKLADKIEGVTDEQADEEIETINAAEQSTTALPVETAAEAKLRRKQEALRLVRIRMTSMNPSKANMKGEIFSVGNAELGMIKKYVPFNAEQGWHVPNIILEEIRQRKFINHFEVKIDGKNVNRHRLIPEYAIEILPPLTETELNELKQRQLMQSAAQ